MYDGIINIYKEKGFTSHDVVAKLRGILRQRKIGHTGTLDPDAEGVLPVCLGKGTKLCDMLTDKDKIYEAEMVLGYETDTQDMSGKILNEKKVDLTEFEVEKAILSFVGKYDQIPPMYSALKVNGQKLCDLARAGITVEREARTVEIYCIDIKSIKSEQDHIYVKMLVHCSKGTYIRTLCHDIGQQLGCGGAMARLIRTKAAGFCVEDALTLDEVSQKVEEQSLEHYIIPVVDAFKNLPSIYTNTSTSRFLYNGNPLKMNQIGHIKGKLKNGIHVKVFDDQNVFYAIYEYCEDKQLFKTVKMF